MAEDIEDLELIKLLNLPDGTPLDESLWRWSVAFETWLEERRTGFHRTVAFASYQAWREFLAFTSKPPWEVSTEDVNAYIQSLEERGLRPGTISGRLVGLGSFYAYCQEEGVDAICGSNFNPVKGARRPKFVKYENVRYLSEKEEAALLQAAQRDDWPISKRDYALILALLRTGWKSVKVRTLTWGELRLGDGVTGGLGDGEMEGEAERLPSAVSDAIRDYLQAAGRLESIRDEEYVFAPTHYHLFSQRRERAEDWDGSRPLSSRQLLIVVKQHARLAGLRPQAITCHTLRHTAAKRLLRSGQSPDAVGQCLGRKGKKGPRAYLRKLHKTPKERLTSRKRDRQMVLSRKPHRFQRRNHMTLTHGLYAKYLPEFEWLAEKGVRLDPADAAVLRWRIVALRAALMWEYIQTVQEACLLLKVVGQACVNVARALKFRQQIRAMARQLELEQELLNWWGEQEPPLEGE